MTNSTNPVRGNEIAMYDRSMNGDLQLVGFFPTGELGAGKPQLGSGPSPTAQIFKIKSNGPLLAANLDGLGSSNSLILSPDKRCLYAVNAGSNSLSSFKVEGNGLNLISIENSHGVLPVSLTISRGVLFVLNSGQEDNLAANLAAFQVSSDCQLRPLAGSVVSLSRLTDTFFPPVPGEGLTTPAQVSFSPDGRLLVVSIKGGNATFGSMVVFPVVGKGVLGAPTVTPFRINANIAGPFSFVFVGSRTLVIVNAITSTVASFFINASNQLTLLNITPVKIAHFAPCWIVRSANYVYTASFGAPSGARQLAGEGAGLPDLDGTIDGFRILKGGQLSPNHVVEVNFPPPGKGRTGNHGIDMTVIDNWLYFIEPRIGMIGRLTINSQTGSLSNLVDFAGLDPSLEPYPKLNPGINNFLTRCFLQDPNAPAGISPECRLGSAQGITGF
jgi:hypothetical protein